MNPIARPAPRSLGGLFWAFSWLSLQGFGGVLAVVHRELVEQRRWLTEAEFLEDWAVAQVMPGPNVCNLALMFGDRHAGWRGAAVALAGLLTLPMVLLLSLGTLLTHFAEHAEVAGALRGMGAVAAGFVQGAGLRLMGALRTNPMGPAACGLLALASFVMVAWLRWPLTLVLPLLGLLACSWAWWRLGAGTAEGPAA